MPVGSRGPVLTVIITSATEGLDKGLRTAQTKVGKFGSGAVGKLAKVAKVATPILGVAAAVAKLGAAGDKAVTAMKSFQEGMVNAGASASDLSGPLDAAIKSSKALAFSTADTQDALLALQTATGDTGKSIDLLSVAQNVARLSGADLSTAANAVAKAYVGQDRALRSLLPGLDPAAKGIDAIAAAEKLAAGQADIFADSAQGMGIKAKTALKGIALTVGKAVAPAFKAMLEALIPVITALGEIVTALLPVLIPLMNAAAKVITKVGEGLTFLFHAAAQVINTVMELVSPHLQNLIAILRQLLSDILPSLQRRLDRITGAFNMMRQAIQTVVEWIRNLIQKVQDLLAPLDRAIDKIKSLNPFAGGGRGRGAGGYYYAPVVGNYGAAPYAGGAAAGGGGVTINIFGDPSVIEAKVTSALRAYARRNGVAAVFTPDRS